MAKTVAERTREPILVALAELLEKRGMTQAALCRAADVSPGTVSRYLSGGRGTRLESRGARAVEKIASALGVEPEYFREYRAWRLREIAVVAPDLLDDGFDLIVELARLRGLLKERPDHTGE
jgi:transcriptional regulator with XRE-family HTH domain